MQASTALDSTAIEDRPSQSLKRRVFHQLLRKKIAVLALAYLIVFYTCGIFAPIIAPYDPAAQPAILPGEPQTPSADHIFGTDRLGRDLFSRVLYSARTTILFTVAVVITGSMFLGLGLGLLAGYRGGWVDTAIMRIGEVLSGLPTLLLIIAITAAFRPRITEASRWLDQNTFLGDDGRTLVQFVIIVGATVPFAWLGTSRIVRSQVLALRELDYVHAAEVVGASTWRVITRHILPGVMPLYIVGLSSAMAGIATAEVSLSFLGLGITEPGSSFGQLINNGAGLRTFQAYPHLLLAPGIPVVLFLFAWNLLGDALVDILEPRFTFK